MQKTIIGCWFPLKKQLNFVLSLALVLLLNGCFREEPKIPSIEESKVVLKKTRFKQLQGWNAEDFGEVIPVLAKTCQNVLKNKNTYLYNSVIKIKTADYLRVCKKFASAGISSGVQMKKFIENEFVPYVVSDDGKADGKFTSYYEATIHASFEKSAK